MPRIDARNAWDRCIDARDFPSELVVLISELRSQLGAREPGPQVDSPDRWPSNPKEVPMTSEESLGIIMNYHDLM